MKTIILGAAFGLLAGAGALQADPLAGTWRTGSNDEGSYLHVTVKPCGAMMCGTIAGAYDKAGTASADYEHLGRKMIWDMENKGGGAYAGQIWAPDTGKTYASKLSLSGNDLNVRGCVAGG